jgi:hypothetical protein
MVFITNPSPGWTEEANRSEIPSSSQEVALLIKNAKDAIIADQTIMPKGQNALPYIDRILELDPGNPQATLLLYTIISRYSELIELVLNLSDTTNKDFAFSEAEKLRNQAAQIITKYKLDQKILEHMDRTISQARTGVDKTAASLATIQQKIPKKENHTDRPAVVYNRVSQLPPPPPINQAPPRYHNFDKWRVIGTF